MKTEDLRILRSDFRLSTMIELWLIKNMWSKLKTQVCAETKNSCQKECLNIQPIFWPEACYKSILSWWNLLCHILLNIRCSICYFDHVHLFCFLKLNVFCIFYLLNMYDVQLKKNLKDIIAQYCHDILAVFRMTVYKCLILTVSLYLLQMSLFKMLQNSTLDVQNAAYYSQNSVDSSLLHTSKVTAYQLY